MEKCCAGSIFYYQRQINNTLHLIRSCTNHNLKYLPMIKNLQIPIILSKKLSILNKVPVPQLTNKEQTIMF